ncbi:MAG: hypothetical protein R2690_18760 [Acidimicrobiales bacterium]
MTQGQTPGRRRSTRSPIRRRCGLGRGGDNGQIIVSHDDGATWSAATMPSGTGGTLYNQIVKLWS